MCPRNSGLVQGQIWRSTLNETWPWCLTFTFDLELDLYFAGTLRLKLYTTDVRPIDPVASLSISLLINI